MEKPIELIEMPFISNGGDGHICDICGGCSICGKDIPHTVGYLGYLVHLEQLF
jgi:hypothetical protein